jgi:hypothetical protein
MRAVKLLLAASGFITYFFGLIVVSALTTSAVHSALTARTIPTSITRD